GRGDLAQQAVDRLDRLRRSLLAGSLGKRRQLQQLEVAGDRPVDVDGGVEAGLGELPSRLPGCLENLLAQLAVGRVQPLGRTEELLLVKLLTLGAVLLAPDAREDQGRARLRPALPAFECEDVVELGSLRGSMPEAADGARRARLFATRRLDARLGDGAQEADEVAGRSMW